MAVAGRELVGFRRRSLTAASTRRAGPPAASPSSAPVASAWYRLSLARVLLLALSLGGIAAAVALAAISAPAAHRDVELELLLRSLALVKLALVATVFAAAWWRLAQRISLPFALAYAGGVGTLFLSATLLLQLSHLTSAAAIFHGTAFATFVLMLQDRVLWQRVLPSLIAQARTRTAPPDGTARPTR
jgi:hypothetical protein